MTSFPETSLAKGWRALPLLLLCLAWLVAVLPARAEGEKDQGLPTVQEKIEAAGLEERSGLLDLFVDEAAGAVWLRVPPADDRGVAGRYLYFEALLTGLGSNPIGLDRGQLGDGRVVQLRRLGGRLLIEEENLRFRALSEDPEERRAVRESFAPSVLWAGPVAALDADGTALVDITSFALRDAHQVVARLSERQEGAFVLDLERSAVDADNCLAFPDNLVLEARLTFTSSAPGDLVSATVPAPEAVTLVQHQSLVRLPDDDYRPRPFDPRLGSYEISFQDYAAPLDEPLIRRWAVRHRLEKVDPGAAASPVTEPIVFYVDSGVPEPVRSALVEGASWWREAFAAAGFEDAFRVEVMPPDMHPLDVRYNVIQWVHRSTRGWSYGGGLIDPRTGEMIKGHVWLGSLRVRQDRLLFEGLAGVAKTGSGAPDDPVEMALARIRQLAAHEVGHALGLAHNFAASSYDDRASVMDYPPPRVGVTAAGELDFSQVYGVGIGSWDKHAVACAYGEPAAGEGEAEMLARCVTEAEERGLLFLSDEDARGGSFHPRASLWDDGEDPVATLERALAVRRIALADFGADRLAPGRPLALLEEVLATVYLHHRFQLAAAAKVLAGVDYRYALRGDGQTAVRAVPGEDQRRALEVVLSTLRAAELDIGEHVLAVLPPRPAGFDANREQFQGDLGRLFDPLAAAATAAGLTLDQVLEPTRALRLVEQHRRNPALPGLEEVLDELSAVAFPQASASSPRQLAIEHRVQWLVVQGLIRLAHDEAVAVEVRRRVEDQLEELRRELRKPPGRRQPVSPQNAFLGREIGRFLERRELPSMAVPAAPVPPPGSPIGGAHDFCGGAFDAPL
ncbi:MAG: zinc-dependent metalloprotease [Acidobacteriota bacterium]